MPAEQELSVHDLLLQEVHKAREQEQEDARDYEAVAKFRDLEAEQKKLKEGLYALAHQRIAERNGELGF